MAKKEDMSKTVQDEIISTEQNQMMQLKVTPGFVVGTINVGVTVTAVSTNEQGQGLSVDGQQLPAIFTTLAEALKHIELLRELVVKHFDEAAQVGLQVIGNQNATVNEAKAED